MGDFVTGGSCLCTVFLKTLRGQTSLARPHVTGCDSLYSVSIFQNVFWADNVTVDLGDSRGQCMSLAAIKIASNKHPAYNMYTTYIVIYRTIPKLCRYHF